jgi:hypothetical protein
MNEVYKIGATDWRNSFFLHGWIVRAAVWRMVVAMKLWKKALCMERILFLAVAAMVLGNFSQYTGRVSL